MKLFLLLTLLFLFSCNPNTPAPDTPQPTPEQPKVDLTGAKKVSLWATYYYKPVLNLIRKE